MSVYSLAIGLLALVVGFGGGLLSLAIDLRFAIDPPKKVAAGIVAITGITIIIAAVYRIVKVFQLAGWA